MFASYRGLNAHPIWWTPDTVIDAGVQTLAQSRCELVRIDFPLNFIYRGRGDMHPWYQERLTRFLATLPPSIEVLGVTGYTPSWANGGQAANVPWTSVTDYRDAVTQLVATYPQVTAWEPWNEPDLNYSWIAGTLNPAARAAQFVPFLAAARDAIKNVNPALKVVGPAISGAGSAAWLQGFYQYGGHNLCDVVSAHMYGDPPLHGNLTPQQMVQQWLASIWPIFAVNDDASIELWITETGWSTGSSTDATGAIHPGSTVDQQALNLTAMYSLLNDATTASRLYWYSMHDDGTGGAAGHSYGLLDSTFTPKGDGSAWQAFNALP